MRRHLWTLVLIMIPAVLLLCPSSRAQSQTDNLFPPAIKMKHLEQYATRLDLSLAQWLAVLDLHTNYKKQFQVFHVNDISPWLETWRLRSSNTFSEGLKAMQKNNDKVKSFRRRMTAFDNEFFQSIESILTETQLERLPPIRGHRARQYTYLSPIYIMRKGWNRGIIDLRDIQHTMTLTQDEAERVEPLLDDYERRLTPLTREVSEICIDWSEDLYRLKVKLGFGETPINVFPDWIQIEQDLWATPRGRRRLRLSTQILTMTLSTAKAIEQALLGKSREQWLDAYIKFAYSDIDQIRAFRRRVLRSIERLTNLPDEKQAFLNVIVVEYERRIRKIQKRNIAATDAYWTPHIRGTQEEEQARYGKMSVILKTQTEELIAIRVWLRNQLEQGLEGETFTDWDSAYASLSTRRDPNTYHTSGQPIRYLHDAPLCILIRDINQVLDRFDIEEAKQIALDELIKNYHDTCQSEKTSKLEEINYWEPLIESPILEQFIRSEAQFLESIKNELGNDDASQMLDWLRMNRYRQFYTHNILHRTIDPILFIFDTDLSAEHLKMLTPIIDEYNQNANAKILNRYHSVARHQRENPEDFDKMVLSDDEVDKLNRQIAILNDATIRRMTAALPEQLGTQILDTFLHASYYFIFEDSTALHITFHRPSLHKNISSDQQQKLHDLQAEYMSGYAKLTDAMVALCVDADFWSNGQNGESVPHYDHRPIKEYPLLRYERDELNAATNIKIRTILTPQQIKASGGLPELK